MDDIRIENICKAYGDIEVFRDFSHCFPAGRACCILGPSGSGKTTLLRMIAGLEMPDRGRITPRPARISFVFQENRLFENLSAEKNVLLTARHGFTRADACELLKALGLMEDAQRHVSDFSGGMQRRTAIARALAADYDLLLMDEPMAGLDGASRRQALELIRESSRGRTLICVTHDPADAGILGADILERMPPGSTR